MISADAEEIGYRNQDKADAKGAVWQAAVYRLVAAVVSADDVVIDIGCGTGEKLGRYVAPVVERAIGVDQARGRIATARRRASRGE